jgi:hypothetical protein
MAAISLSQAAVSAGIGAIVAFVGAAGKTFIDSRRSIDQSLRTRREPAYQRLWEMTRLFQAWPRADVTYADMRNLQSAITEWYYTDGGLVVSRSTQRAYSSVQENLATALSTVEDQNMTTAIPDEDWQRVRDAFSRLRTALTDDLLSRRSGGRFL